MKKVLWIIPLLFIVTGCDNKYQVSSLSLRDSAYYPYIIGTFKNDSDEACKTVSIDVEVISGTLKLEENIVLFKVDAGGVEQIEHPCKSCKNLSNIKDVEIKVKNINCYK